ncbi:MAG: metallophosphoesterase family protein [Rhizobiales bacterium]|nr:metallophosphoesterase family protein [Hyphomicrobiales bacterium]
MRFLAFSDVHNNLACVRKMRAREKNAFDAILFGGDIGRKIPEQFFAILATFECPVFYVYGNWDIELSPDTKYHPSAQILHRSSVTLDGFTLAGFSDKPDGTARRHVAGALKKAGADFSRTILLCHYELRGIEKDFPGLALHLYGHTHVMEQRDVRTTKYVNLGVLDRQISSRPKNKPVWLKEDCRNYIAGNYAIVETRDAGFEVRHVELPHEFADWVPVERSYRGIEWIPEEKQWSDPADPRLPRFEVA